METHFLFQISHILTQSHRDAMHGECGVFNVKFSEKHEPTPAPHIPSLAGITPQFITPFQK